MSTKTRYEISPCRKTRDGFAKCAENDPRLSVWSLYLRSADGLAEHLSDYATKQEASDAMSALIKAKPKKHTPGPWRVGQGGDSLPRIYGKSNSEPICQFGDGIDEAQRVLKNWKANARLIAAAPELLAKLEVCASVFNADPIDPMKAFIAIEQAKAVIALAKGES